MKPNVLPCIFLVNTRPMLEDKKEQRKTEDLKLPRSSPAVQGPG
jgi:hypothetical protein